MKGKPILAMLTAVLMAVSVLFISLPGAVAEATTEWAVANKINDGSETVEELYELAKKEGSVVFYSISSRSGKVAESFMAQYPGVTATAYDISSDELMEKITREYDAGIRNADVIHCKDLDGSVFMEKVQNGIFRNYFPEEILATISNPELTQYSMPLYWGAQPVVLQL